MDRFIEVDIDIIRTYISNLKSNMDRFIANNQTCLPFSQEHLKSNMDRFIAFGISSGILGSYKFKIQYG